MHDAIFVVVFTAFVYYALVTEFHLRVLLDVFLNNFQIIFCDNLFRLGKLDIVDFHYNLSAPIS